ncbi:MAG: hypothetical protein IJZ95_05805 [Oscillospiraceae bacterium]|nr:hypothetical protein [Oscillospiraceae bacterium]
MKQIKALAVAELCDLYGFNVLRHTKDPVERRKKLVVYGIVVLLLLFVVSYAGALSFVLIAYGAGNAVPSYLITMSCILSLMLAVFKASGVIFRKNSFDIISSLPLSDSAVVFSRFLRLYVESLIISSLIILPGIVVYAVMCATDAMFYISVLFGMISAPLVPVAIATAISALITGIASRMKHKAITEAVLAVILVLGVFTLSSSVSETESVMTEEMMMQLVGSISDVLGKVYPPAVMFGNAAVNGDVISLMLFVGISVAAFAAVVLIVSVNFRGICRRLHSTTAKHSYRMQAQQQTSLTKALVQREAKRYFSSSAYVTNTIIGPILAVAMCVALIFVDVNTLLPELPVEINVNAALPFVFSAVLCMMNPSACSVSLEGKQWWIVMSLPLSARDIINGKLLFSLCLIAPFYVVSEIVVMATQNFDIMERIWFVLVPAFSAVLSCVFGLFMNLKLPKLQWETEVEVVKQSASSMAGGVGGILVMIVFAFAAAVIPQGFLLIFNACACVVLCAVTLVLYRSCLRKDLRTV